MLRLHLRPFCQTKSNIKSLQDELDQALTESGGVETPKVKNLKDQLQSAEDELAQLEKKFGELGGEPTTVELQFYPKCRVVLLEKKRPANAGLFFCVSVIYHMFPQ